MSHSPGVSAAEAYQYNDDDDGPSPPHHSPPSQSSPSSPPTHQHSSSTTSPSPAQSIPSRSPYRLPASEQLRGVANRIIFSRYYIGFYFIMMSLSLTTVVLSLMATHRRECPSFVWHILEVVVNAMMVIEVTTRWVAYGKKYPMTPLNIIDLLLVLFCSITLFLVFRSPCAEGTRQEEVLDTILLVIRNAVQFLRLGNILRRSGHSLLNPPRPIDLSNARTASLALDLDLDMSDDEAVAERHLAGGSRTRTLVGRGRYEALFQDEEATVEGDGERGGGGGRAGGTRRPLDVGGDRGREGLNEDDEEMWDRLG